MYKAKPPQRAAFCCISDTYTTLKAPWTGMQVHPFRHNILCFELMGHTKSIGQPSQKCVDKFRTSFGLLSLTKQHVVVIILMHTKSVGRQRLSVSIFSLTEVQACSKPLKSGMAVRSPMILKKLPLPSTKPCRLQGAAQPMKKVTAWQAL